MLHDSENRPDDPSEATTDVPSAAFVPDEFRQLGSAPVERTWDAPGASMATGKTSLQRGSLGRFDIERAPTTD